MELKIIDQAISSTGLTALFKVSPDAGQDNITGYILRAVSTDTNVDSKMEIKLQPTGRFVDAAIAAVFRLVYFDLLHNTVCVLHHSREEILYGLNIWCILYCYSAVVCIKIDCHKCMNGCLLCTVRTYVYNSILFIKQY